MINIIPGTVLCNDGKSLLKSFPDVVWSGGGLVLSQIKEMTGLETSTIQNWVRRGWVLNAVNKRYSKDKVARILIINALRDAMKLEQVVFLLSYINGDLLDYDDDTISDSELYEHFCIITDKIDITRCSDEKAVKDLIENELKEYTGPKPDSKERLVKALSIMALFYRSSVLKKFANVLFEEITK